MSQRIVCDGHESMHLLDLSEPHFEVRRFDRNGFMTGVAHYHPGCVVPVRLMPEPGCHVCISQTVEQIAAQAKEAGA